MTSSSYSFLDYTVMPFLRKRVISSDAAVLFSEDFGNVLWANAIGTRLFGGSNVIDLLDTGLSKNHPLVRQLANAARQLDSDEPVVRSFKISRGLKTETIPGEISTVTLPNGQRSILLSCPQDDLKHRYREHELAAMSVESLDGFADAAAIIDEYGLILASSRQFDAFEIDPATLETLVAMVAREDDRLVKRPITAGDGETIAAGLGRIRDLPARFLVVLAATQEAVEDDNGTDDPLPEVDASPMAEKTLDADAGIESRETAKSGDQSPFEKMPPWLDTSDEFTADTDESTEDESGSVVEQSDTDETNSVEEEIEEITGNAEEGSLLDRWYFDKPGKEKGEGAEREGSTEAAVEERAVEDIHANDDTSQTDRGAVEESHKQSGETEATPQRFAFTIDSDRIVKSVSDELAEAVGPVSGDIVGKSWQAIAEQRGFDQAGTINDLLAKADTWSGRSVLWPVDNTDMCIPIDLAALPVFGKERRFEGFRGFGIIRLADAVVDPNERGLKLPHGADVSVGVFEGSQDAGDQQDEQREPDDDVQVGWRSDIDSEDDMAENASDTVDETGSGDDRSRHRERDNIFHLPNYRSDPQQERPDDDLDKALFSVPSDFGEPGDTAEEAEYSIGDKKTVTPELSGREKRAFGEIRRSLTQDESTEGSNTENTLVGSENSVLGSLPIPLLVYQTSKTLFANEALLEQTGYSSVDELAEAGGIEALLAADDEASHNAIRKRDGEIVPVRSRLTKVDWQGEKALCLSFEQLEERDDTVALSGAVDEKTALDMVRVSELENILETAADGLLIIDADGRIESVNTSGEALFGKTLSDVSGKPFTSLFASESKPVLEKHLEGLKTLGDTNFLNQGQEVIGIEANGGFIPLFAMIGKVGSSGRFCAVLRDLTDWKKTEEELVEAKRKAETANDQKSEFLSRVSHEIREPLTSIIGFSDVMIEERFGRIENERYREYLKDINRSGIHVLDLVNDLLDISKIEAGKLELSYEAVDLNQLASETVALLQPKANNKRIIIRTSLSRAVPKVVADARSIRQIILNLVSNAIQHSQRNSQVIVSTTYEENGEVALRIRDTGRGMSEQELQRALEPFSQLGDDRMENPTGTGLGLPLTKALVEANRAYFELESQKGDGTIAHIQFPSQRVLAD